MIAIKCDSLTKYYGKTLGIKNVDLTVEAGDFFGFIGPNGAGKSTTIRTLLGLINPTSGQSEIFGKSVVKSKKDYLSDIGYLPAETFFYSGMRVKDILTLSAKLYKKDCKKEAHLLCERFELDTTRKIDELSLGNKKKVGIVCALQHSPMLCILDEPTSGLDPLMQREFYNVLMERNKAGATIFLSSHVLSEVQRYCKHAAVIREGEILVSDSVENLSYSDTKRITLRGVDAAPDLDGIKDLKHTSDGVSFLYNGKSDILLRSVLELPITDITITEPDFDEIFMHYYSKEENGYDNIQA